MATHNAGTIRRTPLWAVLATIGVWGCQPDAPTAAHRPTGSALAAKAGDAGAAPIVTATDPASAPQDTTLDVTIAGSGFTAGARAAWSLGGDTTVVSVTSTRVVSSSKLVARVVIPATAPVASYDVIVTLSNGKKGVGAEKFAVTEGDPTASFMIPLDDASLGLRSDRLFATGTSSVYTEDVCGVHSKIFATEAFSNSGDAIMHTDNPKFSDRKCRAYPRKMLIAYGDGVEQWSTVFINVREMQNTFYAIPVGSQVKRALHVNDARCGGLVWKAQLHDGTLTNGADSVLVTRSGSSSWLVETQPYPDDQAYCKANGLTYHIAVRFTVAAGGPLP